MSVLVAVTLAWSAGLALHRALLRRVPAHGFNRAFLLATLFGGLALPWLPTWSGGPAALPAVGGIGAVDLPAIVVREGGVPGAGAAPSLRPTPWGWLYVAGLAGGLLALACGGLRLVRLRLRSRPVAVHADGLRVRATGLPHPPFSFGRWLFVERWDGLESTERAALVAHEAAHARLRHSLDNVAAALAVALAWFHPLAYVLRRELRLVHEFQADAAALRHVPEAEYRRLLLRHQLSAGAPALSTSFSHSPLTLRFAMMTTGFRQTPTARLLTAVVALVAVGIACTHDEVDADLIAGLSEANVDEALFSAAEAASVEGMTLTSVDTLEIYDPETEQSWVTLTERYADPATGRTKAIERGPLTYEAFTGKTLDETAGDVELVRSQPVYKVVEQMPMFPGCPDGGDDVERQRCAQRRLLEHVYTNVTYPAVARDAGVEGMAIVSFVVGTDGEVLEQRIVQLPEGAAADTPAGRALTEELLRLTADMPAWVPGRQDGREVQVRFNLPVRFQLS